MVPYTETRHNDNATGSKETTMQNYDYYDPTLSKREYDHRLALVQAQPSATQNESTDGLVRIMRKRLSTFLVALGNKLAVQDGKGMISRYS
jgi:hypothetical protein